MHPAQTLPILAIARNNWLYANTYTIANAAGLIVYRSAELRHTDAIYRPVIDMLNKHSPRLAANQIVDDEDMMFGKAVLDIYRFSGYDDGGPLMPFANKLITHMKEGVFC